MAEVNYKVGNEKLIGQLRVARTLGAYGGTICGDMRLSSAAGVRATLWADVALVSRLKVPVLERQSSPRQPCQRYRRDPH